MRKILVAIPTRGTTLIEWSMCLKALDAPPGVVLVFKELHNAPFDHMRNDFVKLALRGGYDAVFFLDDDVCVPAQAITRLWTMNLDIVSGFYARRHLPVVPVMSKENTDKGFTQIVPIEEFDMDTTIEADYVGAGCLLIRRQVLEAIAYPWFNWQINRDDLPIVDRIPEDLYFCRKARQAGFKIHATTSVRCLHFGPGRSDIYGRFTPSESFSDPIAFGVGPITKEMVEKAGPYAAGMVVRPADEKLPADSGPPDGNGHL